MSCGNTIFDYWHHCFSPLFATLLCSSISSDEGEANESEEEHHSDGDSDDSEPADDNAKAASFVKLFLDFEWSTLEQYIMMEDVESFISIAASRRFVASCLKELGAAKRVQEGDGANDRLIEWVNKSDIDRHLDFKTKPQMIALANDKYGVTVNMSLNVNEYRNELKRAIDEKANAEPEDTEHKMKVALQTALWSSSLLKPLKKGNDEGLSKYTAKGQLQEEPLLRSFYRRMTLHHCKRDKLEGLYRPGLVAMNASSSSSYQHYLRDSADGVACFTDNETGVQYYAPVEIKSRVTPNTGIRERERLNSNPADPLTHNHPEHQTIFRSVDLDNEERSARFRTEVPDAHERMQLLHHSAVYGSSFCFLLLGDSSSKLIGVYKIRFPRELKLSYHKIAKFIIETGILWAAEKLDGRKLPKIPREVMEAFKSDKLKSLKMTEEALLCRLGLWRGLNVNVPKTIKFPLPPIARVVPFVTSRWNGLKGGGDAITKLDDDCQERIGIRTENNVASSRILLNFGVSFHRFVQILGAKKPKKGEKLSDLYATIHHYRNAASQRYTCKDSLDLLEQMLTKMANATTRKRKRESSVSNNESEGRYLEFLTRGPYS